MKDMDYLAARVHGRRARMAEQARLDALCRMQSVGDLCKAVFPDAPPRTHEDFQRGVMHDLVSELTGLLRYADSVGLLDWLLVRFQVENVKVLLRGVATSASVESVQSHLVALPRELALNTRALVSAGSLEAFVGLLPRGWLRDTLSAALSVHGTQSRPFFLEAAVDRGCFLELLARTERLPAEDRQSVRPLIYQEVDMFHLMLVMRGKFLYGLTAESLHTFHVPGAGVSPARFKSMLSDADPASALARVVGRVIDALPGESAWESLAWERYHRLANRAFRQSHMGLAAVIAYTALRRVEAANLITLSEGIRAGMPATQVRARMIPRTDVERTHA